MSSFRQIRVRNITTRASDQKIDFSDRLEKKGTKTVVNKVTDGNDNFYAEESRLRQVQQVNVSQSRQLPGRFAPKVICQRGRITPLALMNDVHRVSFVHSRLINSNKVPYGRRQAGDLPRLFRNSGAGKYPAFAALEGLEIVAPGKPRSGAARG